jgi:hypothetical protein
MTDQMPALDPRLGDFLAAELQRAERDFPLSIAPVVRTRPLVPNQSAGPARRIWLGAAALGVIGVLVIGLAAGSWQPFRPGPGATTSPGLPVVAPVDAVALRGMTMPLSFANPDGMIANRRAVTVPELRAHRDDSGANRIALTPLAGGEWLLTWTAAPCDARGTLTATPGALTLAVEPMPPCSAEVTVRGVVLRFASSVDPAGLALTLVGPPDPITDADATAIAMVRAGISDVHSIQAVLGTYLTLQIDADGNGPGGATPAPQVSPDLLVWRVDLFGDHDWERVFVDANTSEVVDVVHHPEFRFDVANRSRIGVVLGVGWDMGGGIVGFESGQTGSITLLLNNPANGFGVEVLGVPGCALLAKANYPTPGALTLVIKDGSTPGSVKLSTLGTVSATPMPLPANKFVCPGG